nr:hypothetical protein [uncultured Actinoplanes sp.]
MATYGIDPRAAHECASTLQALTQKLEQSLEDLKTAAARYQAANAGNAINNYTEVQNQLNTATDDLKLALGESGHSLVDIIDNYVAGDHSGARIFH